MSSRIDNFKLKHHSMDEFQSVIRLSSSFSACSLLKSATLGSIIDPFPGTENGRLHQRPEEILVLQEGRGLSLLSLRENIFPSVSECRGFKLFATPCMADL